MRITQLFHGDQLNSLLFEIIICSILILLLFLILRNSHKIEDQIQSYLRKKEIYIKSIPKEFYLFIIVFLFIYFNPASSQLESSRLTDNPTDCKPYITLRTLLTNYQGLSADPANLILIKNRIVNYEKTMQKGQIENRDASQFSDFLNEFHAVSASDLSGNEIISFGEKVQPIIDLYYLENDLCPQTGWYDLSGKSFGRVAEYNYAAILSGVKESTSRILFAIQSDGALGVAEGKNIQNGTTSIDTRFMSSLPAINALYLIPGMNFSNFPQYRGYTPWNLMAGEVLGNQSRTLMDISGIDYFVINSKDYLREFSNAPQWQFKWSSKVLPEGKHILKIIPAISTESDSAFLTIDAIQVLSEQSDNTSINGENKSQIFDDRSSLIQYFGSWVQKNENADSYQRTYAYTSDPNAFLVFPFEGNGIDIFYPIKEVGGLGDVYIDNQFIGRINQSMGKRMDWSNLELINYNLPEVVDPHFTLLKNNASYGLAYFAKSIKYINSDLKNLFLEQYRPPFYYLEREKYVAYIDTVNKMRSLLEQISVKNSILIERSAPLMNSQENQILDNLQGEIIDSNMVANKAVFNVQCEINPCYFIFNMADNIGWHAYIDNQETTTHEANFAFLSVEIPKGQHLVWFEYQPDYLFITLCLNFVAYLLTLFSIVLGDDENNY